MSIILIVLVLVGCANDNLEMTQNETTRFQTTTFEEVILTTTTREIDESQNAEVVQTEIEEIFHLGQSPEAFLNMLAEENINLNAELSGEPDGRHTQWDGYFRFDSEDVRVHFNPQEQVVAITILTPRYATELGIRIGDSREQVIATYGENYTNDIEGLWYNYSYGDLTIGFLIDFGVVAQWVILNPSDQSSRP